MSQDNNQQNAAISEDDENRYWDCVESFINDANEACENTDPGLVSAALLNAAARFNAFVVAHSSLDRHEFAEDLDGTLNYMTGRYRDFLKEHLTDYRDNYATLIGKRDLPEGEVE
ncbi:MAG: DUF3144 domain-containing protein [Cellvibrio sp.]